MLIITSLHFPILVSKLKDHYERKHREFQFNIDKRPGYTGTYNTHTCILVYYKYTYTAFTTNINITSYVLQTVLTANMSSIIQSYLNVLNLCRRV